jgi:hypothetical protein
MMPFRVIVIAVELHGQSDPYLRASLCARATAQNNLNPLAIQSTYESL